MNTPETVNLETVLDFFRSVETSVSIEIRTRFNDWIEAARAAGVEIDEGLVATIEHDLDVHHRLTPETILGAPHAPYASLNTTEAKHFGRE